MQPDVFAYAAVCLSAGGMHVFFVCLGGPTKMNRLVLVMYYVNVCCTFARKFSEHCCPLFLSLVSTCAGRHVHQT